MSLNSCLKWFQAYCQTAKLSVHIQDYEVSAQPADQLEQIIFPNTTVYLTIGKLLWSFKSWQMVRFDEKRRWIYTILSAFNYNDGTKNTLGQLEEAWCVCLAEYWLIMEI